jgi:ArsR family transcriptional regulator
MKTETDRGSSAGQSQPREPLPEQVIELTARRLQMIAEPTRIALLEALNEGEAGVQELADRIGLPHQNASQHLTRLHQTGVVERRRSGTATLYAIADWTAWWVVEQIARWVQSCQDDQGASASTE